MATNTPANRQQDRVYDRDTPRKIASAPKVPEIIPTVFPKDHHEQIEITTAEAQRNGQQDRARSAKGNPAPPPVCRGFGRGAVHRRQILRVIAEGRSEPRDSSAYWGGYEHNRSRGAAYSLPSIFSTKQRDISVSRQLQERSWCRSTFAGTWFQVLG